MRRSLLFPVSATVFLVLAAPRGAAGVPVVPVAGSPVTLQAADGTRLAATYYSADEKPGPGILLCHQCNRDRSSWNELAEKLARAGFHVLTVDYRGFGQSGGPRHGDLPAAERDRVVRDVWPRDLDLAFAYLRARPGVTATLGAGGASCGVNNSIKLSKRHPEIQSLVLLSGGTDRSSRQRLQEKSSPPLLVAAADDDGGVVQYMEWAEAASGNPVNRFVEYQTGGHGTEMFQAHPELQGEIVAWYEATLLGKGKPASTDNARRRNAPTIRLLLMTDDPGGAGKVLDALQAEKGKNPGAPILEPVFVNLLGYVLVGEGDSKGGIAILKFNADAHPASSNAWDSLGDAYLADGQREKAREASEKALALVGSDTSESEERRELVRKNAQAKLDQLKAKPPG